MRWEDVEVEGGVDLGPDTVLAVSSNRMRAAASGMELEQRIWLLVTVRDGKIKRTEAYMDPAEALQAVPPAR
jgi:ketosteroid isomerase-like protein